MIHVMETLYINMKTSREFPGIQLCGKCKLDQIVSYIWDTYVDSDYNQNIKHLIPLMHN